jgi:hypothetical protein
MKQLRPYQRQNANEALSIIYKYGMVYLQHSVRTGKTLTALTIANDYGAKKVLFITKKKAINSILNDMLDIGYYFNLNVINYESMDKQGYDYDFVIIDEAHSIGAYPKPSNRFKYIKQHFNHLPMVLMSGTPCAESASQWYHQFAVKAQNPFRDYANFYKFASKFVHVKIKYLGYANVKDYSEANDTLINEVIKPYVHIFSQDDAGFIVDNQEHILEVEMLPITYQLIEQLKKDLCIVGKKGNIIADSEVKLMNKLHQLGSGTCKLDTGDAVTIDYSKINFIKDHFKGKKIAIFYYFKEELNMILNELGRKATTDIEEFNSSDKWLVIQQYSGSMGINLSAAECLVYLNFGFSGTNFIQSLDRMTTIDRLKNNIYFIFGKRTLDARIYSVVSNKKNYTLSCFKKYL